MRVASAAQDTKSTAATLGTGMHRFTCELRAPGFSSFIYWVMLLLPVADFVF